MYIFPKCEKSREDTPHTPQKNKTKTLLHAVAPIFAFFCLDCFFNRKLF